MERVGSNAHSSIKIFVKFWRSIWTSFLILFFVCG
nr:MAG TPA: hypothetical protein [Caudoviricetes sp.]